MSNSIALNQTLTIADIIIRQDDNGRYCLNDLHKAAGGEKRHSPNYFLDIQQTKELINEIRNSLIIKDTVITVSDKINNLEPIEIIKGFGVKQGTYGVKDMVYAYAMWISPVFTLKVIRAYDALVTGQIPYGLKALPLHDEINTLSASIPAAAPTRLALLKEITSTTMRLINARSCLERETLAIALCEMNHMAGFASRLNSKIITELNTSKSQGIDPNTEHLIANFWRQYVILSKQERLNHSSDPTRMAINLPYYLNACQREGLPHSNTRDLRRILTYNKTPLFIGNNLTVYSVIINKAVRCTVFKHSNGVMA